MIVVREFSFEGATMKIGSTFDLTKCETVEHQTYLMVHGFVKKSDKPLKTIKPKTTKPKHKIKED